MARITAASSSFPDHMLSQEEARRAAERAYAGHPRLLHLLKVFDSSGVRRRFFAFPPAYYLEGRSFGARNEDYITGATDLAERAARACLERASVGATEVDHLILVTTTGLATPSLDARVAARLGLREDVRRWPLFGLGCAGGAGAVIRAADLLAAAPRGRVLAVAVELCGQVFSPRALEPVDVVGAALFGDGAAAALLQGEALPGAGPRVVATRTALFPGTQHLMGWKFTSDGMRLLLSPEVADFVGDRLKGAVEGFLREQGVMAGSISRWILHPGGNRILEEYRKAFDLQESALQFSRASLAGAGNVSSASVLLVLADVLAASSPGDGERGLMVGLGPGFGAEMALLEW